MYRKRIQEKVASIAWKIGTVLNLKFLKLLPGPTLRDCESDSGFVCWLSIIVEMEMELLPVELCFAFHTETP